MARADALTVADVLDPSAFAEHGYPHDAWRILREEAPLKHFDMGERPGFWAVTRRADIVWLSKQPTKFLNAPRVAVFADSPPPDPSRSSRAVLRHLLNMDPPDHARYRNLASAWFTPRAIARRRPEIERIADELVESLRGRHEADFVEDFAAPLTLSVLADMLGVPRRDWRRMFDWTNQIAGASDPEYQVSGDDSGAQMRRSLEELFAYFTEMVERRRARPGDDIVSVLANAEWADAEDGRVPAFELMSYFALLVVAGNETTRNAASGGLLALIEHPDEMAKLRADLSLARKATEEIVRWTSPVVQFCRTPVEDLEMHGVKVPAGESLCLIYASANRDEAAFDAPEAFRVDRSPNPHVGFGIGEHFCLGANLARLEIRIALEKLMPRLEHVELAGPMERMRSSFLGGVKRMPIAYQLR